MTNADEFKQAMEKNIRYGGWYFLGEVYGEYLVSYAEKMQEVMDRHRASNRFANEDDLTPGDAFIMYLAIWLELTGNASSLGTELFNLGIKLSKAKRQKKEKELKETVKRMHEVVLGLVSADDETANIYDKGLRRSVNLLLMEITILIDALMHKPDDGTGGLLPINYDEPIMDEWPIQVVTRGMMEEPMIIAGMMYIIVKMQNYVLGTLQRIRNKQVPIEIDEEPIQVYRKAADRFKNFVVSSKVSTMQLTKLAKERWKICNRSPKGERSAFSRAWIQAASSISTASISAWQRWASIRLISPVPQPTSSMRVMFSTQHQAPNKTPSVPTFIAHLSCQTVNCLNWK